MSEKGKKGEENVGERVALNIVSSEERGRRAVALLRSI